MRLPGRFDLHNDGAGKSSKPPKHLFLKEETIPGYQFSSSSGAEKAA
jgi:hypothetical protein